MANGRHASKPFAMGFGHVAMPPLRASKAKQGKKSTITASRSLAMSEFAVTDSSGANPIPVCSKS
jgi:hypothetical protein